MPRRVIKQPNGNYALFSSVADHFVWYDATEGEARELLLADEMEVAERRVDEAMCRAKEDWPPYTSGVKGSGRERWNNDAYTAFIVHRDDDPDIVPMLLECGMTQDEIDAWLANDVAEEEL